MHENEQLFELPVKNEAADIDFKPSSFNTKKIDNKEFVNRNQMINVLKNYNYLSVRRKRNIPKD